jgi:hypothetical protein
LKTSQIRENYKCDLGHLTEINLPPVLGGYWPHAPKEVVRDGPAG